MATLDLDTPLIELLGKKESITWTIGHAVEGVQIFGGIGSGKTSGSGRTLALKFLNAGFGGLVLTVKPDEKELWQQYCKITNRERDLVIIEPGGDQYFNFLQYESRESNSGTSITTDIVHVLKTVLKAGEEKDKGKTDDAFWENALEMLMHNIVDLCKLAYGYSTIEQLYQIAQSIPKSLDELKTANESNSFVKAVTLARQNVKIKAEEWKRTLSPAKLNILVQDNTFTDKLGEEIQDFRLLVYVEEFFKTNYITLNEKTRSIIEFSFVGFLFRFMRDPIFTLFSNRHSTVEPEDCLTGKIILINLPVKIFGKVGRDAQIMFKYTWQRAMERRPITPESLPVFLWADEAQNFIHEHDADYQATARSSRIITVYISQNLPNYFANMGGEKSEHRVKSFLGTLNTKIFHANADIHTNNYASELIGRHFMEKTTFSETVTLKDKSQTTTKQDELEAMIRPEKFARLKTGGKKNEFLIEAYVHKQGDSFSSTKNCIKMKFNQNYIPT